MPAQARKCILPAGGDPVWVHGIQRCVRRAFLCGDDARGVNRDYRKDWIEKRLRFLGAVFACEISAYAVMSNHVHVVLRMRPDWAALWDDAAVVRAWLRLYPGRFALRETDGTPCEPSPDDVAAKLGDAAWIAERRERLGSLSWLMRCFAEPIARRANHEEDCTGRFWEGRFTSVPLLDYKALIACMVYVDLNPIRAKMADSPENSTHTGARTRIEARQGYVAAQRLEKSGNSKKAGESATQCGLKAKPKHAEDGLWLAPIKTCMVRTAARGVDRPLAGGSRYIQKGGFMPALSSDDYLQLIDATGRLFKTGKRGAIPQELAPILTRLDVDLDAWLATMQGWREFLGRVVGEAASRAAAQTAHGVKWLQNRCALFGKRKASAQEVA